MNNKGHIVHHVYNENESKGIPATGRGGLQDCETSYALHYFISERIFAKHVIVVLTYIL
jgi:hypothetical protein